MSTSGSEAPSQRADTLYVAMMCVLALALRVLPFSSRVFSGDGLLPSGDADVFYHLRRIELASRYWPHVPDFDAWMSVPTGSFSPWPPLFDFVPATLAHVSGLPSAVIAVAWPPLLGALSVLPFWSFSRAWLDARPARLALLLFVLLPANVAISLLGRVDHHVAEVGLQLSVYALFARDLRALESARALSLRASIGLGLLLGACLLTWAASLIYLWLLPAAACVWMLPPRDRSQVRALARHLLIAFVVAALCCAPFALHNVARGRSPFAYYHLSLLTVLLCCEIGGLVAGFAWLLATADDSPRPLRARATRAACVASIALSPLLIPALRTGLAGGLGFLGRRNEFVSEISESAPLLSSALTRGFAHQHAGYAYLLLPLLCIGLGLRWLRTADRSGAQLLLALYALNVTALAFMQARFLYCAGPLIAALPALALQVVRKRPRFLPVAAAACCLLAIWPALAFYWSPLFRSNDRVPLEQIEPARLAFLLDVAAVTPPAGDSSQLARPPRYAVFAPWSLGHQLLAIAERGVVANNYGDQLEGGSFADEERFYRVLQRDDQALSLLARRHSPFVITSAQSTRGPELCASRLHLANGSDLPGAPGSGRFRLRAQSTARNTRGLYGYKLFAVVAGALLRAPPGPDPLIAISEQRVSGQSFEYQRALAPAGVSLVEARLAYPGDYRLLAGGHELARFTVSERAVEQGETITLARSGEQR